MKILILFGHPAFQNSNYNRKLIDGLDKMENITFHDLYEAYPELDIDIDYEQELLAKHDCIVFHFPMYWYSSPAIFKEWQDLVLEHDWAYGSKGNALKGKLFFTAITTGGPRAAFTREGFQQHTIHEFIAPFTQMARLCKMIPLPPFVIQGTHLVEEERLNRAQKEYHTTLSELPANQNKLEKILQFEFLNELIQNK